MRVNVRTTVVGLTVAAALGACGGAGPTGAAKSTASPSARASSRSASASSQSAGTSPTKTPASAGDECGPDSELPQSEWMEKCAGTTDNEVRTEGSVTTKSGSSVTYPDGIKVQLVKVTRRPNRGEIRDPGGAAVGNTIVEVTERYTNTGKRPWKFPDDFSQTASLLYGANRYEATGWANDGPTSLPARLMPGTSAKESMRFTLNAKDTKVLAVTVNPNTDVDTDYTFTDVETLLER